MTAPTIDYRKLAEFGYDEGAGDSATTVSVVLAPANSGEELAAATFLNDVLVELERAESKHPPMHSAHEAYAVILEELDEFKEEVWKKTKNRDAANMYEELVQTAAMCLRAALNLRLYEARP